MPLTATRAKPAMPFGGSYRVADFVLSNLLYSKISQVMVLTQYESDTLHDHIRYGWYPRFGVGEDRFIQYESPHLRQDHREWYRGTADAVTQNLKQIMRREPKDILVLGGDHVYLMDYRQMQEFHRVNEAEMTVAGVVIPVKDAAEKYGVLEVDKHWRLVGFEEKPAHPKPLPNDKDHCIVSMGNYLFRPEVIYEELQRNQRKRYIPRDVIKSDPGTYPPGEFSSYDFGFDILPAMMRDRRTILVYDLSKNENPGMLHKGYWKDIGSLTEYYTANMDLLKDDPPITLTHPRWRVRTYDENLGALLAHGCTDNRIRKSLVSGEVSMNGAEVERSILSSGLAVAADAHISGSILLGGATKVGKGARIRNAIIDEEVTICPGVEIGFDPEQDEHLGLTVADGLTIVPRGRTVAKP